MGTQLIESGGDALRRDERHGEPGRRRLTQGVRIDVTALTRRVRTASAAS